MSPLPEDLSIARTRLKIRDAIFVALWLFVVFVSVVDGLLIVVHRESIAQAELNPMGSLLLEWNDGRIWLFVAAKLAATIFVGAAVLLLYQRRPRWGLPVAASLACFQLWLLLFLCLK